MNKQDNLLLWLGDDVMVKKNKALRVARDSKIAKESTQVEYKYVK